MIGKPRQGSAYHQAESRDGGSGQRQGSSREFHPLKLREISKMASAAEDLGFVACDPVGAFHI